MRFFVNLNVIVDSYDKLPAVLTHLEALSGNPIAGMHYHAEESSAVQLQSAGGAIACAAATQTAQAPVENSKPARGKKDKSEANAQSAATPAASAPAAPSPSPSAPPPAAPAGDPEQFQSSLKQLRAEAARVIEASAANRVQVQALVKEACGEAVTEPKLSAVPLGQHADLLKKLAALAPKKD